MKSPFPVSVSLALSAVTAAVAGLAHSAGFAPLAEKRHIALFVRYRKPPPVNELKLYRLSGEAHSRPVRLIALDAVALDLIEFPVLYKAPSRTAERKFHVVIDTFLPQKLNPVEITGTHSVVVLTVTEHMFYLPRLKIFPHADLPYKRRAHNALVLKRKAEQYWYALVGTSLVFSGNIEEDVFPAIAPIPWKMFRDVLGTLREQEKDNIAALAHYIPRVISPFVDLGEKKSEVMQTRIVSPLFIL